MKQEPVAFTYKDNNINPNTITFNNMNSQWVMKITADRKLEINDDVEVSEAARIVLDSLQELLNKTKPQYRELSDEEIREIHEQTVGNINLIDFARAILKKASEK